MNDPHVDKAKAETDKASAKLEELKAQLKIAAADARIGIQNEIAKLEARLKGAI
jgi:hypothetical protein